MKERQLLTRILQNGKEQGLFNINNPSSFAKTLLIMFKSLEQPFIIIGHRKGIISRCVNMSTYYLMEY